jgi:membrane-associated phospholipid phosphatase
MKKKKLKFQDVLIRIPSMIFSSPVVTILLTVVLTQYIPYKGLIISSAFFYILMPILIYTYLYKIGLITDKEFDFNIRKREERPLSLLLASFGFLTNYVLISMYNLPQAKEIALFFSLAFFVFAIITIFWKISGHMTQTVITILILAYAFSDIKIYILLIGYLICVPLVGYSRIKLKHHNIWQVIAGTLVTTAIGILVFTII